MIPKECKRLAEVDFPIAVVSKHAVREKSIRHGHPSTLHLWWARRPLASCRAMMLGLLLPDPSDENCPPDFKKRARELLPRVQGKVGPRDGDLRQSLLKFIGDFANWDLSADRTYLEISRALVKAGHPEETPLVVDPFAGGGSIPLEALRIGCEAFASDLNPVACLILKVMLEDIARAGVDLAVDLRRIGSKISTEIERDLRVFYVPSSKVSKPIAYVWAKTIQCESPTCGSEIPLVRSFWLSKKPGRKRALRYKVERVHNKRPAVSFEVFEPKADGDVPAGTVSRARAACPCCNMVVSPDRVRAQLALQKGGADVIFDQNGDRIGGARILAVVGYGANEQARQYVLATKNDYSAVREAQSKVQKVLNHWVREGKKGLCPIPDEQLPQRNTLGLRVPKYGIRTWGDMFSARQKLALLSLSKKVTEIENEGTKRLLALAVSRTADYNSANCSLHAGRDVVRNTWARNALPVVWDFYEANPFAEGSGSFEGAIEWIAKVTESLGNALKFPASVQNADAYKSPLPDNAASIWFTDPPYYNAIGYAESSDFFFVWLKRVLPESPFSRNAFESNSQLTPKLKEIIQDDSFEEVYGLKKDPVFFEESISLAFKEGRRVSRDDAIASIVFAHKTTEGWEALLSGILTAGWTVTGSWPIQTEMENKVSGSQAGEKKAMLLASIHLVCRPRPFDAPVGDWGAVIRELPRRVGDWMERLQSEGVRGADLVFACIGPALEIYSRYSKVVDAEDREIPLGGDPEAVEPFRRGYLAYIWEAVGRAALEQVLASFSTLS